MSEPEIILVQQTNDRSVLFSLTAIVPVDLILKPHIFAFVIMLSLNAGGCFCMSHPFLCIQVAVIGDRIWQ